MFPKVHIILLNWNGFQDTIECLDSLRKIDYPNFDVIVVDNHSDGDDVAKINNVHGEFIKKIIVTESNLGFSGGNNIGIKYAMESGTDFIMLLNNDTIVETNFISELINNILPNENVGIYTPMINYYSKPNIVWCAGGYISKFRGSGFSYGIDENESMVTQNRFCSFASGCCLLIKSEVIKKIGLLDDKYFLYLEDTDYCLRVISAGFQIKFIRSSKIYHKVFSTTAKVHSLLHVYYSVRNRLSFAKKNLGYYYYWIVIYLATVFFIKSLLPNNLKKGMLLTILDSFHDHFHNVMGKSDRF